MFNQLPAGKTFQARETFHHPRHGGFLLGAEDDDIDEAGDGDEEEEGETVGRHLVGWSFSQRLRK